MKMSVRYGIIGLGNQGTHYLFDIFEVGKAVDAVVSAVCDINPAKIENVKQRAPKCDPVYFENYIEMLDSGLCDALSTALFVMTLEEGRALLQDLPGYEAVWVSSAGEVSYTQGIENLSAKV
jgi:hypothetical protein